jgi:hypothetical protein
MNGFSDRMAQEHRADLLRQADQSRLARRARRVARATDRVVSLDPKAETPEDTPSRWNFVRRLVRA